MNPSIARRTFPILPIAAALPGRVNPVESLRRYHEQFLPVTFEGCWMACVTPERA